MVCSPCAPGTFENDEGICEDCSPCCKGKRYSVIKHECFNAGMGTGCSCAKSYLCVPTQQQENICTDLRKTLLPTILPMKEKSQNESKSENETAIEGSKDDVVELSAEKENENSKIKNYETALIVIGIVAFVGFSVGFLVYQRKQLGTCCMKTFKFISPSSSEDELTGKDKNSTEESTPTSPLMTPTEDLQQPPTNPEHCYTCAGHIGTCSCPEITGDSNTTSRPSTCYAGREATGSVPESAPNDCRVDIYDPLPSGYINPLNNKGYQPDRNDKSKVERAAMQNRPYIPQSTAESERSQEPSSVSSSSVDDSQPHLSRRAIPDQGLPCAVPAGSYDEMSTPSTPNNSLDSASPVMVSDFSNAGENKPEVEMNSQDFSSSNPHINHDMNASFSPVPVENPDDSYGANKEEENVLLPITSGKDLSVRDDIPTPVSEQSFAGVNKPECYSHPQSHIKMYTKPYGFFPGPPSSDIPGQTPSQTPSQVSDSSLMGANKPEVQINSSVGCNCNQNNLSPKYPEQKNVHSNWETVLDPLTINGQKEDFINRNIKPEEAQKYTPEFLKSNSINNNKAVPIGPSVQETEQSQANASKESSAGKDYSPINEELLSATCSCLKKDLEILDEEAPTTWCWNELANSIGIKEDQIKVLRRQNKKENGSATRSLLEMIPSTRPDYCIGDLKKDLKKIKRLDVIKIIDDHRPQSKCSRS